VRMTAPRAPGRRRFSPAADVAERLRSRILDGEFADGDVLPKIDDLSDEFGASRPAVREAFLMLESEGLVTVKRGNVGGAVVHLPTSAHMAYTLGLVLQSRGATLLDVRAAIERFEPLCVELCAERADRMTTVVPALEAAQTDYRDAIDRDDGAAAVLAARTWHEALIAHCGNETVQATVGMLESIWTSHLRSIAADTVTLGGHISPEHTRRGIDEHDEVIRLIAAGEPGAAAAAARDHLRNARVHAERPDELDATVSAAVVRDPRSAATNFRA
jgi:GntR family transcriptional regulator, transcriptional repressor for pyruvate dehydrogenase complex